MTYATGHEGNIKYEIAQHEIFEDRRQLAVDFNYIFLLGLVELRYYRWFEGWKQFVDSGGKTTRVVPGLIKVDEFGVQPLTSYNPLFPLMERYK